jgi:hypothetical protein
VYSALSAVRPAERAVSVETVGAGPSARRVYSGSTPLKDEGGRTIAFGYVVVVAGQQTLFRGESPTVLRGESRESIESFYRPITVAEFQDRQLLNMSAPVYPIGYRLPISVEECFADPSVVSFRRDEYIEEQAYETFYVRHPSTPGRIVALSVPAMGLVWHLINILKVSVYYAIVVLVSIAGVFVVLLARGQRYEFKFRDRLLVALLVTALVPVVFMATYGRKLARDRMVEAAAKRLAQETSTLSVTIARSLQGEEGIVHEALSRSVMEDLADEAGTDFNLYVGNQLQASSRPELYEVGILDRRLSGLAHANTVLRGKRFHLQSENIGSYQYVVGFSPRGSVWGRFWARVGVAPL